MYLQKVHSFYISVYSECCCNTNFSHLCMNHALVFRSLTDDLKQRAGGRKNLHSAYLQCIKSLWIPIFIAIHESLKGVFSKKLHSVLKNDILLAYQKQNWIERIWWLSENQGTGSYLPLSSTPVAMANFILEEESEIQWELMNWMHEISGYVCSYVKTLKNFFILPENSKPQKL